nr:hypothetical protein [Candidatus Sigynarchaeota archaeon]
CTGSTWVVEAGSVGRCRDTKAGKHRLQGQGHGEVTPPIPPFFGGCVSTVPSGGLVKVWRAAGV